MATMLCVHKCRDAWPYAHSTKWRILNRESAPFRPHICVVIPSQQAWFVTGAEQHKDLFVWTTIHFYLMHKKWWVIQVTSVAANVFYTFFGVVESGVRKEMCESAYIWLYWTDSKLMKWMLVNAMKVCFCTFCICFIIWKHVSCTNKKYDRTLNCQKNFSQKGASTSWKRNPAWITQCSRQKDSSDSYHFL